MGCGDMESATPGSDSPPMSPVRGIAGTDIIKLSEVHVFNAWNSTAIREMHSSVDERLWIPARGTMEM